MSAATMGSISTEECSKCKSPAKEANRALCVTCLNRNLQRAYESIQSNVVLKAPSQQPRFSRCYAPSALFPGMPRAVLGPANSEKGHHTRTSPSCCTSKTSSAGNSPVPSFGVRTPDIKEADRPSLRDVSKDSHGQKIELPDEAAAEGRGLAGGEEQGNQSRPETKRTEERGGEEKGAAEQGVDRWHLFRVEKNLTVRIPNPPIDISIRPPARRQPLVVPSKVDSHHSLPPRKEVRPRQGLRLTYVKSSIKPNVNAEAELMMRLLADSIPILKSTAPLVLPPCKMRPAPVSPLSSPEDPLWKRRSITCPKSLKVQDPLFCVS